MDENTYSMYKGFKKAQNYRNQEKNYNLVKQIWYAVNDTPVNDDAETSFI